MSRCFGYVFPRHKNGQNHERKIEEPVVPLDRNLYGHPLARLLWEKTIRASFIRTRMGENSELGMYCSFVVNKAYFSQKNVDDIRIAGKKQNLAPMWKRLMKKTWILTNLHHFLTTCIRDALSGHAKPNEAHHWTEHKNVRITYFCWSNREIYRDGKKPHAQNRGVVPTTWGGHAQKMRWAILRTGTQESGATSDHQFQARRTWISPRIVRSLRTNCLEMFVLGTNRTTWHPVVREQIGKISHTMNSSMW